MLEEKEEVNKEIAGLLTKAVELIEKMNEVREENRAV